MKMYEAAQTVLRQVGHPMHAREIYDRIVVQELFQFGAKNPVAVLSQTLRQKSDVGKHSKPLFTKTDSGAYGLVEWGKKPATE